MNAGAFFRKCAGIEKGIGDLYRRLAELSPDKPEIVELFLHTALEEDTHSSMMSLMSRLVQKEKEGTKIKEDAEKMARTMEEGINKVNAMLDAGKPLPIEKALAMAIQIESSALEAHSPSFLETKNEELRNTAEKLTRDTTKHREKFAAALKALKSA